ncbi:26S proteasome complex subunit SEM1 [Varanus komodoensis]|nr:26S proteasome complex subunit SEM1 [Varanus komodoensis]
MSEKKQPVDLGLLEEDDEFEEFPAEDWAGLDEDEDAHVWEDNWDDDNVEDDFSNQLRTRAAGAQDLKATCIILLFLSILSSQQQPCEECWKFVHQNMHKSIP